MTDDPYRHHPGLRGMIRPTAESIFRDLDLAQVDARVVASGMPADWRTPDAEREAGRKAFLHGHWESDLWVFAYGSLMWDPGVEFVEVRRARTEDFARRFCLFDEGGRGSADRPGLQLALDRGPGCDGLAFRIEAAVLEHETFVLFRREMIAPAYRPVWLPLETSQGDVEALAFVADHASPKIVPGIPPHEMAQMISGAAGFLGSNFDYLAETRTQLARLGVTDPYIDDLFARAVALRGGVD